MHQLAKLIISRKGDASFADLSRRSRGQIGAKTLEKWANPRAEQLTSLPTPETIMGIAAAIGVSVELVLVAAARAAGIPVRDRLGAASEPLGSWDLLTPRQQDVLIDLAAVMADPHGGDLRGVDVIPREKVAEAARLVDDALTASGVSVPVAADAVPITARRWRRIIAGQEGGTRDEWLGMAIASGADPEKVFDALGVPMPVDQD